MSVNPVLGKCTNFAFVERKQILDELIEEIEGLLKEEKNNDVKCGMRSTLEIIYKKKKKLLK